jgi:hypothetical protein
LLQQQAVFVDDDHDQPGVCVHSDSEVVLGSVKNAVSHERCIEVGERLERREQALCDDRFDGKRIF